MKSGKYTAIILVCLLALITNQCSIDPVSSGGTETGNPGVMACAAALFQLSDTTDVWLPSYYLIGGDAQLDPGYTSQAPSTGTLSKRSASLSDSLRIITQTDTVISIDTVMLHDTLYTTRTRTDTITDTLEWGINHRLEQNRIIDTTIVFDTVVVYDTSYFSRVDTVPEAEKTSNPEKSGNIFVIVGNRDIPTVSDTGGSMSIDMGYGTPYEVNPSNLTIYSDTSLVWTSRNTEVNGLKINEIYSDGDGDSLLFLSRSTLIQKSILSGSYNSAKTATQLKVLFDAGKDKKFYQTADNRIYSLRRTRTTDSIRVEDVAYLPDLTDETADSVDLIVKKSFAKDSLAQVVTRFVQSTYDTEMGHHGNRLKSVFQSRTYRFGALKELEIKFVPCGPLKEGEKLGCGSLFARFDYGKGCSGELDAVVDFTTGKMTGTYIENRQNYNVIYDNNSLNLILNKID